MGGSSTTQAPAPTPPSAPSIGSSISEYVQAQPQLFALQQQQAPQEAQQQLDLLQEFGPQFGQAIQDAQAAINPETTALQEQLAGQAREGIEGGLSESREEQLSSDIRANLGSNVGSEIGAFEFGRQMDLAKETEKDKFRNLGLSLAGRQQLAQPQAPAFTNQVGSFNPGQALGFNQGIFGTQGSMFGSQAGMYNQQQQLNNQASPFGSALGILGGSALGGVGSRIGGYQSGQPF